MDIYEKLLQTLPRIASKAWLISQFDEDPRGKIRPRIVPRYFGYIVLDTKKQAIYFEGSFMKIKKKRLLIPLEMIEQVSIHMVSNLRIKWRGKKGVKHNAIFQVGQLDALGVAHPSKKASEVWVTLIERAKARNQEKRRKKY